MDDLPPSLILEILSRLNDYTDLARCRLASKTLDTISYEIPSLSLLCSHDRYLKSKSPNTRPSITPFKTIVKNVLLKSRNLEFIAVGVEMPFRGLSDDEDDESDDLHLTAVSFVSEWLPEISGRVKSLSISDFWVQSCWRRSEVLSLISSWCQSLLKLEVKNAWLSVEGLKPMPMLTSLTLEFIRLDDEDLNKVNHCFPSLQTLSLIGVGGFKEPKINLVQLRTCRWTVSNAPLSLAIHTPNLIKLELRCVKPRTLVLEAPLLSDLNLSIEETNEFQVKCLFNLKSLKIQSTNLNSLAQLLPFGRTVETLMVDAPKWAGPVEVSGMVGFEALSTAFPNLNALTIGPGAWLALEMCFLTRCLEDRSGMKGLKRVAAHLVLSESTFSFISSVLDQCTNLSDVALLIHRDIHSDVASHLISSCTSGFPRIRWRWGTWKEGTKDNWVSYGIQSSNLMSEK